MTKQTITTPITELFGIRHPVILAGMSVAAGTELAAAVTNAGGLGVIGGVGYTPKILRQLVCCTFFVYRWLLLTGRFFFQIRELKEGLEDKNAPFGVDLLIPAVGGGARKTNVR